ncbi:chemotaxis protein CheX [Methylotenera sp. G11]|jgi:chemotaxis protein CheX|uniref:chemotaxis protein CheX n=1 Tax=Methylotenera sp. G11 TaxID=1506585 RepID=UPI00068B6C51|nr:chemotaxis protein CheX [Methylotenera sp. G11]
MSDLSEKDIEIFIEAIGGYFKQITKEAASVGVAYLAKNAFPMNDYTGMIKVSADYEGALYFSAPSAMLRHLLTVMKEPNQSDENLLDAVGEIANTISGNARKYFGENMVISIPEKIAHLPENLDHQARPYAYVIIIKWKHYSASLIVDISRIR